MLLRARVRERQIARPSCYDTNMIQERERERERVLKKKKNRKTDFIPSACSVLCVLASAAS